MQASTRSPSRHPFRHGSSQKVYHLHGWEKTLLIFAGALLIFQPWALGGMRLWSQYTATSLALIAFIVALIPRNYTELHHAGSALRLIMWPKLLRFPFFWLGLIYFGYVLIQIYNPAWQFIRLGSGWAVMPLKHIAWLPHGVAGAPIEMMNGWRTLLIQITPWLLVCALWVGITRRKSIHILLTLIAVSGTTLALAVLLQRLTGTKKILWLWDAPAHYFAGSFIYKNHAGAFFVLIIATCLGLAWWHMVRAERELRKSHPGIIYAFMSLLVFTALAYTYARAASILAALLLLTTGIGYITRLLRLRTYSPPISVSLIIALLSLGFLTFCIASFNSESIWRKFIRLFDEEHTSISRRILTTRATFKMSTASLPFGHGAGNFRYIFPYYQRVYPEIWEFQFIRNGEIKRIRTFYEYAHNDYAQLLAENGLIGAFLWGSTLIVIGIAVWQNFVWRQPALLLLLAGPSLVAINAWTDFPMHNPAILVGICGVTALTLRWATLGQKGS